MVWVQGEDEATGSPANSPPIDYANHYKNLMLPGMRDLVGNPTMPTFMVQLGRGASAIASNDIARIDNGYDTVRRQFIRASAASGTADSDPNTYIGASWLGGLHAVDPGDFYHYQGPGYGEIARRVGYTIAKYAYGINTPDGLGPQVASAAISGAAVTLTLDLNGAASLVEKTIGTGAAGNGQANTVKGYQVSATADFAALLPISTVATTNNKIIITLASAPGSAVYVRSYYGATYDDTVMFHGDGYADSRPSIPTYPIILPLRTPGTEATGGTGGGGTGGGSGTGGTSTPGYYRSVAVEYLSVMGQANNSYAALNDVTVLNGGVAISRAGCTAAQNLGDNGGHTADLAIDGDGNTFAQCDGQADTPAVIWQHVVTYPSDIRPDALHYYVHDGSVAPKDLRIRLFPAGEAVVGPYTAGGVTVYSGTQSTGAFDVDQTVNFNYPNGK